MCARGGGIAALLQVLSEVREFKTVAIPIPEVRQLRLLCFEPFLKFEKWFYSALPKTRRAMRSASSPSSSDAHWCLQSDGMPDSRPQDFLREDAPISHFARQCIEFYKTDWHTFQRKHSHFTHIRGAPVSSEAELSPLSYEADQPGARTRVRGEQAGLGLNTEPNSPVVLGAFEVGGVSSSKMGTPNRTSNAATLRARRITSADTPPTAKWPRRKVQ